MKTLLTFDIDTSLLFSYDWFIAWKNALDNQWWGEFRPWQSVSTKPLTARSNDDHLKWRGRESGTVRRRAKSCNDLAMSLAGVSLWGNASFVNVPVTRAHRHDHASRPIGRRGRERDGKDLSWINRHVFTHDWCSQVTCKDVPTTQESITPRQKQPLIACMFVLFFLDQFNTAPQRIRGEQISHTFSHEIDFLGLFCKPTLTQL